MHSNMVDVCVVMNIKLSSCIGVRLREKSSGIAFDQASGDWWTYPSLFSVAIVDKNAKVWAETFHANSYRA
jgi:hypothetical protein